MCPIQLRNLYELIDSVVEFSSVLLARGGDGGVNEGMRG